MKLDPDQTAEELAMVEKKFAEDLEQMRVRLGPSSPTPRRSITFAGHVAEEFPDLDGWRISEDGGGCHMADLTELALIGEVLRLQAKQSETAPRDEIAWLVERPGHEWLSVIELGQPTWTKDANKAIKFPTQDAANAAIGSPRPTRRMQGFEQAFASEHIFRQAVERSHDKLNASKVWLLYCQAWAECFPHRSLRDFGEDGPPLSLVALEVFAEKVRELVPSAMAAPTPQEIQRIIDG